MKRRTKSEQKKYAFSEFHLNDCKSNIMCTKFLWTRISHSVWGQKSSHCWEIGKKVSTISNVYGWLRLELLGVCVWNCGWQMWVFGDSQCKRRRRARNDICLRCIICIQLFRLKGNKLVCLLPMMGPLYLHACFVPNGFCVYSESFYWLLWIVTIQTR